MTADPRTFDYFRRGEAFRYAGKSSPGAIDYFRRGEAYRALFNVGGGAASFTITEGPLPSNHLGNITVHLVGSGTSWTSSTTWTPSGVAGWSYASKVFVDSTHYTVVLTPPTAATPPAGATGTLTLTEGVTGTTTGTVGVATPTVSISPTSGNTGTTPTLAITGANTLWTTETAAGLFTEAGGTGASIGTPTVTTNTAATAVLTTGSAAATEVITDTSTGASTATTGNFSASTTALVAGAVTATPARTSISFSIAAPTGGTGPYFYKVERADTLGGSLTTVRSTTAISTTVTFVDSPLTYRTPHQYKVTYTDSQPASVVVNLNAYTFPVRVPGIINVGDSITRDFGGTNTATQFGTYLKDSNSDLFGTVLQYNCGISGYDTVFWSDFTTVRNFTDVTSFDTNAVPMTWMIGKVPSVQPCDVVIFSCMLGTNDANLLSGAGLSTATFQANYLVVINKIKTSMAASYPTQAFAILLHYPPSAVPFPASGSVQRTEAQHGVMQGYQAAVNALVDNVTVFQGDRDAFGFFLNRPDLIGVDNLHPNPATGGLALKKLHTDAISTYLYRDGYTYSSGGSAVFAPIGSAFIRGV
jgi:hypothetical protein